MFNNPHHFSDNRPMGHNHPTRMVEHYFPHNAFDVVQQVHFNLGLLHQINQNLPMLNQLGNSTLHLNGIHQYLGDIVNVAMDLNNIVTLNSNLPLVQDLAPRISSFAKEMECLNKQIQLKETKHEEAIGLINSKIKLIEDLYVQYECGLKHILEEQMQNLTCKGNELINKLEVLVQEATERSVETSQYIPMIKQYVDQANDLNARMLHLEASDAVTVAIFTKEESDFTLAKKAIKKSEGVGNDERVNKQRLEIPESNNMYDWLKASNGKTMDVVIKEPEVGCCKGGCNG